MAIFMDWPEFLNERMSVRRRRLFANAHIEKRLAGAFANDRGQARSAIPIVSKTNQENIVLDPVNRDLADLWSRERAEQMLDRDVISDQGSGLGVSGAGTFEPWSLAPISIYRCRVDSKQSSVIPGRAGRRDVGDQVVAFRSSGYLLPGCKR
jgi:hypothetical protein